MKIFLQSFLRGHRQQQSCLFSRVQSSCCKNTVAEIVSHDDVVSTVILDSEIFKIIPLEASSSGFCFDGKDFHCSTLQEMS